jgi:putative ABC transport system substrate-binding protein
MRRRDFLIFAGGAVAARAPDAGAQQREPVSPRVGVLYPGTRAALERDPRMRAFFETMRELGWVEGVNIVFERRYAEGQPSRLPELAAEFVRLGVAVIVTLSSPPGVAAKKATNTIPIVIIDPGDPVATGLVASLARPGGNVTGISSMASDLAAKRVQILKEAAPRVTRVGSLFNAAILPPEVALKEMVDAAATLGIRFEAVPVRGPEGFADAFAAITRERADGLVVFADPLTNGHQALIVNFAAEAHIAALYANREFVDAGGLLSYGPNYPGLFRRGANYVDRILRGAKPADLPIEQPTKFELVINLKTAKVLGLTVPQSLLARADEVIE